MCIFEEGGAHEPLCVHHRSVTVPKVKTPYFDTLVSGAGDEEVPVRRNVNRDHGELVPVHREVELERVQEKYLQVI